MKNKDESLSGVFILIMGVGVIVLFSLFSNAPIKNDGGGLTNNSNNIKNVYYTQSVANIRSCPKTSCSIVGTYEINTPVYSSSQTTSDLPEWVELTFPDGKTGYINKINIGEGEINVDTSKTTATQTNDAGLKVLPKLEVSATEAKDADLKTPPKSEVSAPPANTILCNGKYYSNCSSSGIFQCPTDGSPAYCGLSKEQQALNAINQQQLEQQNLKEIAQAKYLAQYQAVQAKIQPLQVQGDALMKQSQSCTGGEVGAMGAVCLSYAQQANDVFEYIGAIQGNLITPVTDNSIVYENKLDDLAFQIFKVKIDYHKLLAAMAGTPMGMDIYNGRVNQALMVANAKIDTLNSQMKVVWAQYQSGLNY